jgi:ABC-2 type transport system permease protein
MIPESVGEVALDLAKLALAWVVLANVIAVARGTAVTAGVASAATGGSLGLVALWKVFRVLVGAMGKRAIGAAYALLLIPAGVALFYATRGTGQMSRGFQVVNGLLPAFFVYVGALGAYTAATGRNAEAANPLGIAFDPLWYRTLWVLFAKEVRTFFTTAVPYLVFFVFMLLNGILFFALVRYLNEPGRQAPPPAQIIYDNLYFWVSMWLICPAITMRLVAEERRMGTIESLLTAPVTDIQVIVAKFASAFTFFAIMISSSLAYLAILAAHSKEWDWGPVLAGYLAIGLIGAVFLSIGLFWSTLTQSQMVAYLFGAVTNVVFFFMSMIESFVKDEKIRELAKYVSFHDHYREMLLGVVTTRTLIFFVSVIAFFLFCSVRGLESQKWK